MLTEKLTERYTAAFDAVRYRTGILDSCGNCWYCIHVQAWYQLLPVRQGQLTDWETLAGQRHDQQESDGQEWFETPHGEKKNVTWG